MSQSALRHRPLISRPLDSPAIKDEIDFGGDVAEPRHGRNRLGHWSPALGGSVWLLVFTLYAIILLLVHTSSFTYSDPVMIANSLPGQFVEERARKHLEDLTLFGSRPVGSIANEELTVNYLLKEIAAIRQEMAYSVHHLEAEVQQVSGTFSLDFLGQFTSYYENVNNVLVKLSPKHGADHSLLVNCHYDTSINTTGASDDTVSCCVMLEVLRVMSRKEVPFSHSVIFIFNGAEENILQASHGFITQHPWAKEIRAFVNLEACGAGGKQLLFQSGPEHPWLVGVYASHAPHPFASIVGQEVFQSGLIPSDTDFRIYRDYGGLPGLDMAYIYNGYVYHTVFDNADMIPAGSIQQAGDNVLAIVSGIVNSPYLADPAEYRHGQIVFFDFLGQFMIIYPMRMGTIINTVTTLVVMGWIGSKLFRQGIGFRGLSYVKHLAVAALVFTMSLLFAACSIAAVGFTLHFTGHAMSWFSNTWLIFGLYVTPAAGVVLLTCTAAKKLFYKDVRNSLWDVEAVYFDLSLLLNTIVLSVMTYHQLCSAIMLLTPVLFPVVLRLGAVCVFRLSPNEHQRTFVTVHLLSQLIPNMLFIWFVYGVTLMFIPIMGRAGTITVPDIVVGGLAAMGIVMVIIWQMGLVFATRSMQWTLKTLLAVFLLSFIAACFSPMGFPYRANVANPTRQRMLAHHLERNIRDVGGNVVHSDSGILLMPLDCNTDRYVSSLQSMQDATSVICHDLPYCGWPYYFPMIGFIAIESLKYKPSSKLSVVDKPRLSVLNRTSLEQFHYRTVMSIEGPNHINIYLSPRQGVQLTGWSVGDGDPQPTDMPSSYANRPHYFIFYSYGSKPKRPFELGIDIRFSITTGSHCMNSSGRNGLVSFNEVSTSLLSSHVEPEYDVSRGFVDVALGGHYITVNGTPFMTSELNDYVESLPDWTTPLAWPATYDTWVV